MPRYNVYKTKGVWIALETKEDASTSMLKW